MNKRSFVGSVLVLALVPTVASTHHLDQLPVQLSIPTSGNMYVSMRVVVPADAEWGTRFALNEVDAAMIGMGNYNSGMGAGVMVWWGLGRSAYLATDPTGKVIDVPAEQVDHDPSERYWMSMTTSGRDPGTHEVVMLITADGSVDASFELIGTEGVRAEDIRSGPATLIHDEQFSSVGSMRAREEALSAPFVGCVVCVQTSALFLAEETIETTGRLYGWYSLGRGITGYEGTREFDGTNGGSDILWDEPAGRHRFHAEVGVAAERVWLMYADVLSP